VSFAFSEAGKKEFGRLLTRYPDKEAVILPALHLAQKEQGYVSDDAIVHIAELLGTSPARIEGVATFYTMYNRKPVGKYNVQICRNISCSLLGAEHLIAHVSRKLGIPHLVKGQMIADLIAVLGSVNIIAGELDR
jgi:NADH-quinone oxidoreductase subunit E